MRNGIYTVVFNGFGTDPQPIGKFVVSGGAITSAEGIAEGLPIGPITPFVEMRMRHLENGYYSVIGPGGQELQKSEDLEKGLKGDWQKEGYKISHSEPDENGVFEVQAHDKHGKLAGYVPMVHLNHQYVAPDESGTWGTLQVYEPHQRKGLASAMYMHAEKITGKKVAPGTDQSHEAHALWRNPGRQFGKSALIKGASVGRPEGRRPQDYDPEQLEVGVRAEMEKNAGNVNIARDTAMDNLDKNPRYYAHLVKLKHPNSHEVSSVAFVDGDHLLMGKRNDNQHWTLPGGHLDHGESPQAAAMREASEETGIELKPDDLHYLGSEHVVTHGGKRLLIHSFVVFGYVDTDTEYDPDQEVQRWVWVDVSRGLPYSVEEALHSPRNTTLKLLGLQTW